MFLLGIELGDGVENLRGSWQRGLDDSLPVEITIVMAAKGSRRDVRPIGREGDPGHVGRVQLRESPWVNVKREAVHVNVRRVHMEVPFGANVKPGDANEHSWLRGVWSLECHAPRDTGLHSLGRIGDPDDCTLQVGVGGRVFVPHCAAVIHIRMRQGVDVERELVLVKTGPECPAANTMAGDAVAH